MSGVAVRGGRGFASGRATASQVPDGGFASAGRRLRGRFGGYSCRIAALLWMIFPPR